MKEANKGYVVLISLIVALGGFLMGFDASVISGVVTFIEPEFSLTKIELGWAVSSLTLTATLAMMISGPLSDKYGRKRLLFFAAILYAISAIASALAPSFIILVIARMIGGFGVGASLIIAPMYIAEIAPPKIRGMMVSFNQLNIVIGISVAFFTNFLILKLGQSDAEWVQALKFNQFNWRWMLGLETLSALLYFFALFIVPRSPRWLVMRGKEDEALKTMRKVASHEVAISDLKAIKESIQEDADKEKTSLKDIFQPAIAAALGEDEAKLYEIEILKSAAKFNANLILFGILAFVASFAISIGPVMWVMFSELFPNTVRAVSISFVGFINSIISFLVQLVFPWELETIGSSLTFLIYGLFGAAGLIFVLTKVPETKGKSLEELEKILVN